MDYERRNEPQKESKRRRRSSSDHHEGPLRTHFKPDPDASAGGSVFDYGHGAAQEILEFSQTIIMKRDPDAASTTSGNYQNGMSALAEVRPKELDDFLGTNCVVPSGAVEHVELLAEPLEPLVHLEPSQRVDGFAIATTSAA